MKEKKKKKTVKKNQTVWRLILLVFLCLVHVSSFFLVKTVVDIKVLPSKYSTIVASVLIVLNLFVLLVALKKYAGGFTRWATLILSLLIIAINSLGTYALPYYKGRFEKMFVPIPDVTELYMNVYTLQSSGYQSIEDLSGRTLGIQSELDFENQQAALEDINSQLGDNSVITVEYEDFYAAVDALYAREVDAILINEMYADIIIENADYPDFDTDTVLVAQITQEVIEEHNRPTEYTGDVTKSPFIIGIAGNDNFRSTPSAKGRTDANIICAVNPNTRQILMITVPRDSYLPIGGNTKKMDKLTHHSIYGVSTWRDTIAYLLGYDVNFYVRINFRSLIDVVDALGGLTIYNPYAFKSTKHQVWDKEKNRAVWTRYSYKQGTITLTGNEALLYVRERYALKTNDMGRNEHQAIVLKALIDTVTSKEVIGKADVLLQAMEGKFLTDMTSDQIFSLIQMQLNDMRGWGFTSYSLTGKTGPGKSYAMGQRELSMVFLNQDTIDEARALIDKIMNNEVISETDLTQ
ncbi:MAG: LCP family protein [Erysipelotrichaceae bacterium]|nr:LCP family protein [Erysipelotrichaceae bacterium]